MKIQWTVVAIRTVALGIAGYGLSLVSERESWAIILAIIGFNLWMRFPPAEQEGKEPR